MGQESSHSAAGQALGYFHQCMWALVELGKRASLDPAAQLRLEVLDDIEFGVGGLPSELLQIKHHTRNDSPLTAQAIDLWRTLNVWMDLSLSDLVILRLVTTRTLSEESGLIYLRNGVGRNTSEALKDLVNAAKTSTNKATKGWRERFLNLDDTEKIELLDRIIIDDGSLPATRINEELIRTFRFAYPPGCDEVFLNILKGWWSDISVKLLAGELKSVTGYDLTLQVAEITDQLKSDSLPIDPTVRQNFDESVSDLYKDRPFVQQLLWIAMDNNRLWKAIRDYHRSYSQRSFWLRHQLLGETEINQYAFLLYDEWEIIFDSRVAEMKREGRMDPDIVGQEILEQLVKESQVRLRDRFNQPWFNRGMFHALADGELGHRVGWHPDFESKLEVLLSHVSSK